jgi:hypothetical protein
MSDAMTNAVANTIPPLPSRQYRLQVAVVEPTGVEGVYEAWPFAVPEELDFCEAEALKSTGGVQNDIRDGMAVFECEEDALDAWMSALWMVHGRTAQLTEEPGTIRNQKGPCYKLTDPTGKVSYVVVVIDEMD